MIEIDFLSKKEHSKEKKKVKSSKEKNNNNNNTKLNKTKKWKNSENCSVLVNRLKRLCGEVQLKLNSCPQLPALLSSVSKAALKVKHSSH